MSISNFFNCKIIQIIISCFIGFIIGYSFHFLKFKSIPISEHSIKKGTICIIIDDYGFIFNDFTKDFLELHPNITSAIIPGSPYAKTIAKYIESLNNESIIHMPMESFEEDGIEYNYKLHDRMNSIEVENEIISAFEEIPMALGINNHQGSKATENLQLMKNVARTLKKNGKYFLDSYTNPESRGYITMRRYGVPTQLRQVFLDHIEDSSKIESNLDSLVNLSHIMDIAIGIGHTKPLTLEILKNKIPKLEKEGYEFIRLSSAVK